MHDDVQVVAHYRIGEHVGCEAGGDQRNPGLHPVFAVLERLAGVIVDAAQERTSHAALHAVEGAWGIGRNELGSWLSHDRHRRPVVWQPLSGNAAGGCREFLVRGCPVVAGLGIVGTRRTLYVGNLEIVSENSTTTYKRYIGGVLVQNVVNGIAANSYLFHDHIGSVIAATNENGVIQEGGGFNASGERRVNGSATSITQTGLASTTRGFTGHEMLDGLDVIHMNGRIYDPTLGRFLQADPVIQDVTNPQSWNAYTYVFNNPYRYTDPTGMVSENIGKFLNVVGIALQIIGYIVPGAQWLILAGKIFSAVMATYNIAVGIQYGGLKGGLLAAFGSAVGYLTVGMSAVASTAVNMITAGVSSVMMGGNFARGMMGTLKSAVVGFVSNLVVGGTITAMTGGKYANGGDTDIMNATVCGGRNGNGCSDNAPDTTTYTDIDVTDSMFSKGAPGDGRIYARISEKSPQGFADDVRSALNGLSHNSAGVLPFSEVSSAGHNIYIRYGILHEARAGRRASTIDFNPRAGLFKQKFGKNNDLRQSPMLGLLHEAAHVYRNLNWNESMIVRLDCGMRWSGAEENLVTTMYEKPAAIAFGESIRNNYSEKWKSISVSCPTCTR